MESKLYVGNLSYQTTEDQLRELFGQAGAVQQVDLIKDRETGTSKGFAFVTMSTPQEAEAAIRMFNGQSVDNRELRVNVARPREERPQGGGGYGEFGGRGGGAGGGGNRGGGGGGNRGGDRGRGSGSGSSRGGYDRGGY